LNPEVLWILVARASEGRLPLFRDKPRTISHRSRAVRRERAAGTLRHAGAILIYVKRTVGLEYILTRVIEAKIALTSK
jgi:hypothetical protein